PRPAQAQGLRRPHPQPPAARPLLRPSAAGLSTPLPRILHPSTFFRGVSAMFGQASRRHPKPSGNRRRPPLRPFVEELEPRLTPAEVGVNDFRISHMGNDGDARFGAFDPAG